MAFHPDDRYDDWQGIYEDLKQRIPFYLSDFYDGFAGEKTLHKTISATIFLYFACILPAIAFGVLNLSNTGILLSLQENIFAHHGYSLSLRRQDWGHGCYCGSDPGRHPVLVAGWPTSHRDHDHRPHRPLHQDHRRRGRGRQVLHWTAKW